MKNKNVLVWLLVVLAVAGAVFIGYTYRGTFLQGKMGRDGKGSPVSGPVSGSQVNDAINRAEFAKLLAVALEGESVSSYECKNSVFTDVKDSDWFAPYVCYLLDEGLLAAKSKFYPAKTVNRAEAAKILVNAYSVSVGDLVGFIGGVGNPYTDISQDSWFYSAIYYGAGLGFFDIKPYVGAKFYPINTLSKGRAQLWIDNFKKAIGK